MIILSQDNQDLMQSQRNNIINHMSPIIEQQEGDNLELQRYN